MKEKSPTICILDALTTNPGDLDWQLLEAQGVLTVYDRTSPEDILERAAGKEILITNKVVLTGKIIEALPALKAVFLMSTGTNAVDLEACRYRGIPVCNIPAYSTPSVAEHTIALLLAWARGIEVHSQAVQAGAWVNSPDFCFTLQPQRELAGMTMGLVGFGDIAQSVCVIAHALGMRVLASTPHPAGKPELGQIFVSQEEVFAESDVISLHCPLVPATEHLINRERLASAKRGVAIINTGRGGLIHEQDLADALKEGQAGAALLDVLSSEPPASDNPLLTAPNTLITPHIAWATKEARGRLIEILAGNVSAFLSGSPRNVVNDV